jgi:hypothetical protein
VTLQQFSEIFALLAVQLRFTDADEATIRGYFRALSDVEPELVAMAAQRFALGATIVDGVVWFPKAPEWRAMARKVEQDRREELDVILRRRRFAGEELCRACDDTGWAKNADGRVTPCTCREARRLEVLGRRPMPALPAFEPISEPGQVEKAEALALKSVRGMR